MGDTPHSNEVAEDDELLLSEAVADATPDNATLSRRDAASLLGVDERTVRRMAKDGRLTPVTDGAGQRRFRTEQIREVTVRRRVSNTLTTSTCRDGETAAALFTLFDEGVGPVDVVKRLQLPPRAVAELYRDWVELRGGIFIAEVQLRQMCAQFDLPVPVGDGEQLLAELVTAWRPQRCTECELLLAEICLCCGKKLSVARAREKDREKRSRTRAVQHAAVIGLDASFAQERSRRASHAKAVTNPFDNRTEWSKKFDEEMERRLKRRKRAEE